MSLNGKLEDVSLGDVMQFIHLGRRTGTLSLSRGHEEAEIGFHRGQIVSAWAPGSQRLGDLLVSQGVLTQEDLRELLQRQHAEQPRRSLGQILVQSQILEFEVLRKAIEEQIERTIYELVTWIHGSFEFALDELKPIDDIAMYPGDVIPKLNLNTQMVLLEATRVYDERRRAESLIGSPEVVSQPPMSGSTNDNDSNDEDDDEEHRLGTEMSLASVAESLEGLEVDFPVEDSNIPQPAVRRLQIVSSDRRLADEVGEVIRSEIAIVVRVPLREAGTRLPGEPTPTIVVLDMRHGNYSREDLLAIRRSRPRSSVIALVDSQEMTTQAFESGAVAAIPASCQAIVACFNSLIRAFQDVSPGGSSSSSTRAGFARLRRVLADIRSGLLSATMALNLMHILSESVERAILFLVQRDHLSALGAFGFGVDGNPLAEATRSLRLDLHDDNILTRCITDGQLRSLAFERSHLPPELADIVGRPYNGQIVVFPVMGSERVISVVYTDNGASSRAIEDIELLELATAQVGVAFENELLRRQIDRQR